MLRPARSVRRNESFAYQVEHCEPEFTTLARNPLIMKKITFGSLPFIVLFLFALLFVQPALAHGGEPRLEISVERINPGGLVEVRGVDFDEEESIVLSLTGPNIQIPLIEVTTDLEGTFTQVIVFPADLPTGEYNFIASTEHHMITSPTITVWGVAVQNQEDSGIRDQSDVQLGPMPTLAPSVSSTPLPQTTASDTPASRRNSPILIFSILTGVVILALIGIRIFKKQ
jgi:hypothetical protein